MSDLAFVLLSPQTINRQLAGVMLSRIMVRGSLELAAAQLIDFSAAACLPVTWEIMRSFVQSSSLCRTTATIDIPALCEYVWEYMRFSPLTKNDMIAMPYVYLFQLAQSRYGYPQYLLNPDSEDREGLLRFAFWRTKMCREVEKKAEEISNELVKLL